LCVLIAGSGLVFAREKGKAGAIDVGVAVSQDFTDEKGNVIRITVIPPSDRVADRALLEGWEFEHPGMEKGVQFAEKKKNSPPERTIDVTGYHIMIEAVRLRPAQNCNANFRATKASPFFLGAGGQFQVSSTSPEQFDAAAYPTLGDVDIQVFFSGDLCGSAILGPGRLDRAGCFIPDCSTTGTFRARIYNASNIVSARFVGTVSQTFIQP
jgi:hypothetical protein